MKTEIKRILIVDDSPKDIELTIAALSENNLANEIIVAEDGEEALDYLYKRGKFLNEPGYPAIILLDIKMPKMDGLELLHHIRANDMTRLLPVVVLTTSSEDRDKIESYKLGANSYIRKPVDFTQFVEAVQQLGLYWLVLNEAP